MPNRELENPTVIAFISGKLVTVAMLLNKIFIKQNSSLKNACEY